MIRNVDFGRLTESDRAVSGGNRRKGADGACPSVGKGKDWLSGHVSDTPHIEGGWVFVLIMVAKDKKDGQTNIPTCTEVSRAWAVAPGA